MTDKPLDCVGLDPAISRIGKHDFRAYSTATTNAAEKPAELTISMLDRVTAAIKQLLPPEDVIDHAAMGTAYFQFILSCPAISKSEQPGFISNFSGIRFFLDEQLPPDVCEFRNKDGKVLRRIRLATSG